MVVEQYDIFLAALDPAVGHELKKSRPCVVISPNEMNRNISTAIVAPMTTKSKAFPSRIPVRFQNKEGWVVLDQIRTLDTRRFLRRLGRADNGTIRNIKTAIHEIFVA